MLDPTTCPHEATYVEATIGGQPSDHPADAGLPWQVLHPEQEDLDGIRVTVSLGACGACGSRVVSVRSWDAENWTPEHGPAWTSAWTRLVRDGQARAVPA
jgi:hypothetical protein